MRRMFRGEKKSQTNRRNQQTTNARTQHNQLTRNEGSLCSMLVCMQSMRMNVYSVYVQNEYVAVFLTHQLTYTNAAVEVAAVRTLLLLLLLYLVFVLLLLFGTMLVLWDCVFSFVG